MVTSTKLAEWLSSQGLPLSEKALQLRTVVDPETEPFRSKYEAIDIYTSLLKSLETIAEEEPSDRVHLLTLGFHLEAAFTSIDVEDMPAAERSLQAAIEVVIERLKLPFLVSSFDSNDEVTESRKLEGSDSSTVCKIHNSFALMLIQLYNLLGYLKSMKLNFAGSVVFFKEAEKLYFAWEKNPSLPKLAPLTLQDLLSADPKALSITELSTHLTPLPSSLEDDRSEITKSYTMTIYYIAQAYQQMGEYAESARYCHQTLRQQHRWLDTSGQLAGSIDHIEWALNAATLSQYFAANEHYSVARHLIACARHVWRATPEATQTAEDERWRKAGADLDRIEVKYCLTLLDESFRLLATGQMEDYPSVEWKFTAFLLKDPEVEKAEAALPSFPVRDYTAAKSVVKHALAAIDSAKRFFTLSERASDHVDVVFDHSSIFGSIVPFEPSVENRCKMVKRRIDMLEALAGELNPQYFLEHCRKIHYELGDIYSQQVGLKYIAGEANFAKFQGGEDASTSSSKEEMEKNLHAMKKINLLTVKAIQHYYIFLRSFEVINTASKNPGLRMNDPLPPFEKLEMFPLPERIDEDVGGKGTGNTSGYLQAIITAYLAIGRLYIKLVTSQPADRVRYWLQCEKYYKALKEYLTRNEDQRRDHFSEYWTQLEEMLALIPGKIQSILSQSVFS